MIDVKLQSGNVPISQIVVRDRKRELGDVTPLAESIKSIGLLNPITIQPDGTLIAGYHRLEACRSLGWNRIAANVYDLSRLDAELAEIDENLERNELHWFDRDKQILRRKEIYEERKDVLKHGGYRTSKMMQSKSDNPTLTASFASDTAHKMKAGRDAVFDSLKRARSFTDEQGGILKKADVKPTEATRLARKSEYERNAIIAALAASKLTNVKSVELSIIKKQIESQAQVAPSKPQIAQASWDTWLPTQKACDLLITDPPYSTDIEDIEAFAQSWLPIALSKVKDSGRAYVCIGAYPQELRAYLNVNVGHWPHHMRLLNILVWTYKNTLGPRPHNAYKSNWQAILYFIGLNAPYIDIPLMNEQFSVQEINAPDGRLGDRYHAWQKPDDLAERLIRHSTKPGDTILDCFAGTGTFLLAAHRLGRVAYGCDSSPEMLEIARTRGCEVI
ncbi:MAG: DNA modification methylase [Ktedonobacteraceae bacterium]